MENIIFKKMGVEITTYVKGSPIKQRIDKAGPTSSLNDPIGVSCADEVPLFYYEKGKILGLLKLNKQDTDNEVLLSSLRKLIDLKGLNPEHMIIYIGATLTFSHTPAERPYILETIKKGYGPACKRCEGVDYIDIPLMTILMLRKLGIPMKNIYMSNYDTFESPNLFYSRTRGDKLENYFEAVAK